MEVFPGHYVKMQQALMNRQQVFFSTLYGDRKRGAIAMQKF